MLHESEDPLRQIVACVGANKRRRWGDNFRDMWLYGIVIGWEEKNFFKEIVPRYKLSPDDVRRLKRLRARFLALRQIDAKELFDEQRKQRGRSAPTEGAAREEDGGYIPPPYLALPRRR